MISPWSARLRLRRAVAASAQAYCRLLLLLHIDLGARLAELSAHLFHAALLLPQRRGVVAHLLGDLHGAEFRPAHRAEMGELVRLLGQRLVMEAARGVRIER